MVENTRVYRTFTPTGDLTLAAQPFQLKKVAP